MTSEKPEMIEWPSCGHTSTGVCRKCYELRGRMLDDIQVELRRALAKRNEALAEAERWRKMLISIREIVGCWSGEAINEED